MKKIKNVSQWLDISCTKFPDKLSFSDGKESLTYRELRDKALRIATFLAKNNYYKKPIVIRMDKTPSAIAAFFGCAYSGNIYVPVDVDMPTSRLTLIHSKIEVEFEITNDNYHSILETETDYDLIASISKRQADTDILYVLFTSGSTGTPKGVAVHNRGVIEYTEEISRIFQFSDKSIHAQAVPLFFDSSILPIYQTVMHGGTDYLIPKKVLMFPPQIIDFLNEYKCNSIYWVPTLYNMIAKLGVLDKKIPLYVNKCLFMGEAMPCSVLNVWRTKLPDALFANLMGPTEVTDTFAYYIVDRDFADSDVLPIGHAYDNVSVFLLNENNQICKPGEIGEFCVSGSKISFGYYNDPEKTSQSFVQNPLNKHYNEIIYRTGDLGSINERGEFMSHGRKDFQIKITGHRVELGEIETVASSIPGVSLCACVFNKTQQKIILLFVGNVSTEEIRAFLKKHLQSYMIPASIINLPAMPMLGNGKVDRNKLRIDYAS